MSPLNNARVEPISDGIPPSLSTIKVLRFRFPSGEFFVRSGLASIIDDLKIFNICMDDLGTAELVLAEVLNNISEHAYGSERSGKIEVACTFTSTGLHFSITDDGIPMPNEKVPLGICADINVPIDEMPEGGFGWFLIETLARDIEYRRLKSQNILSFRLSTESKPTN